MIRKVLIVDESKHARRLVIKALKAVRPAWGYAEAGNADEALAVAARDTLDVALLDFDRDGLQLAVALRAKQPSLVVGIMTATLGGEIRKGATRLKAAFLPEPLTDRALRAFLEATSPSL